MYPFQFKEIEISLDHMLLNWKQALIFDVQQELLKLSGLFPSLVVVRETSGYVNLSKQETETLKELSGQWIKNVTHMSDMYRWEIQLRSGFVNNTGLRSCSQNILPMTNKRSMLCLLLIRWEERLQLALRFRCKVKARMIPGMCMTIWYQFQLGNNIHQFCLVVIQLFFTI